MKSEFVVSKIEASQDEKSPLVYVVFTDTKSPRKGKQQQQIAIWGYGYEFYLPRRLNEKLTKDVW